MLMLPVLRGGSNGKNQNFSYIYDDPMGVMSLKRVASYTECNSSDPKGSLWVSVLITIWNSRILCKYSPKPSQEKQLLWM